MNTKMDKRDNRMMNTTQHNKTTATNTTTKTTVKWRPQMINRYQDDEDNRTKQGNSTNTTTNTTVKWRQQMIKRQQDDEENRI